MRSETRILKLLLGNREKRLTIRKIAEGSKTNYRIAYEKMLQFEKDGLIRTAKAGHSKTCELTNRFDSRIFEAEYERRQDLFKNRNFLIIHNRLAELEFPFIALLFGSHAKGGANRHSDIDILAIGGDEKKLKAAISLLPDKIHLTNISYADFINMAKSREFTVVSEAMKNNVLLVGIEEYYRLTKNAE